VRRFTPMPCGGHFPAAEEPELLAKDIAAFFAALS
jgi:pimeloyl-ACP methyl ester carboxylesterase